MRFDRHQVSPHQQPPDESRGEYELGACSSASFQKAPSVTRGSGRQLAGGCTGGATLCQERVNAPDISSVGEQGGGGTPQAASKVGPRKFPVWLHKEAPATGGGMQKQPALAAAASARVLCPMGWRWPRRPATASRDALMSRTKSRANTGRLQISGAPGHAYITFSIS